MRGIGDLHELESIGVKERGDAVRLATVRLGARKNGRYAMTNSEHESISMDDLKVGVGKELLAEAEVILAVDGEMEEEVLYGKWDWELAVGTGHDLGLTVVRVEIDDADDIGDLKNLIESLRPEESDEGEGPTDDDAE